MLAGEDGEDATGLGPLAGQHRVGQPGVEQEPSDAGVLGHRADQVGDARPVLLLGWCGGDGGLGGGGDVGDHAVEDRRHQGVLVGEALVEVPGGDPRPRRRRRGR